MRAPPVDIVSPTYQQTTRIFDDYDPFIDATKTYFSSCHTKTKLITSGKYSNKFEKQRRRSRINRVSSSYHLINTIAIPLSEMILIMKV